MKIKISPFEHYEIDFPDIMKLEEFYSLVERLNLVERLVIRKMQDKDVFKSQTQSQSRKIIIEPSEKKHSKGKWGKFKPLYSDRDLAVYFLKEYSRDTKNGLENVNKFLRTRNIDIYFKDSKKGKSSLWSFMYNLKKKLNIQPSELEAGR